MIEGFLSVVFGLVIGSFLNVCIYRLPAEQSVIFPGSHCNMCGSRLKAVDLVPVFSYLLLGGRCRYCGEKFSPRYALVELLTAGMFYLCWAIFGLSLALPKGLILISFLIVITFIDYDHQLIFDKVLVWLAVIGAVFNLATGEVVILDMVGSALVGGGFLLIVALVSGGGMGGGDIKFVAALGLWFGWKLLLLAMMIAFVVSGITGALLLTLKLKGRKDAIPFGPFIAIGAAISLLYGAPIIRWYWQITVG
ncbi:MAG: Prepilin peptidase [Firmicutes bacterium]|nr:Prepilin peptidase [Bacillota bacterium]